VFTQGLGFGYHTRCPPTSKQDRLPLRAPEREQETDESRSPKLPSTSHCHQLYDTYLLKFKNLTLGR
jgi:hypothetical protein